MTTPPYELSKIRTVADVKPSEPSTTSLKEKIEIKDLLSEPIQEKIKVEDLLSTPIEEPKAVINTTAEAQPTVKSTDLQAHFIRDTVPDGSVLLPAQRFVQVWTLRNPGPYAWPVGCSVRYVGGDNMLNVDDNHPSSAADISKATESNVIDRAVEIGEQIEFRVVMKAPKREGVAISYWRLKADDGTPFGHRLWCHINVRSGGPGASAQRSQEAVPEAVHNPAFLKPRFDEDEVKARRMQQAAASYENLRTVCEQTKDRLNKIERDETTKRLKQLLDDRAAMFQDQLKRLQEKSDAMKQKRESMQEKSEATQSDEAVRRANRVSTLAELLGKRQRQRLVVRNPNVDETPAATSSAADVPVIKDEEAVTKQGTPKIEDSAMIFPTLEKESPSSSTHEDHIPTNGATSENVPAVASADEPEFFEDAESVSLVDESEESAGFLTDEEYDILDASDEELV
jgi:next-to-BRCA1 protein 1